MEIKDNIGRVPYLTQDSSRAWAEQNKDSNGIIRPQLALRLATDSSWIHNMKAYLPAYGREARTGSIMNCGLPTQTVWGAMNWSVTESHEDETAQASFEIVNALPVSTVTTTATTALSNNLYSNVIIASYITDSLGVTEKLVGNTPVENHFDAQGYRYHENKLRYRQFDNQSITLSSAADFPNPGIPTADADNDVPDDAFYAKATNGVGAYYIRVDQEIMRVCAMSGNILYIPPGGRAQNGILQAHGVGATIDLLGFGPHTGEYVGHGMFAVNDYKPYMATYRTGTCVTSYEGYGKITGPLVHAFDYHRNYTFTGFWFVHNVEDSVDEAGVPRLKVSLNGVQDLVSKQKITIDVIQRMKTKFGEWELSKNGTSAGAPLFAASAHRRDIPGDWVDYDSWDPTLKDSYPLKIKTEVSQHKEFFDHMADTQYGKQCIICRHELKAWKLRTGHKDTGAYVNAAARAVGRHIYKQSIRVQHPIQTYIRLMLTMCMMTWDHPPQGVDLAQKFTKIPNSLFNNIRNVGTGLIYNGQLDFDLATNSQQFDWTKPTYDSLKVVSSRTNLTCPFESSYDNVGFSQPIQDLAEANDMFFWVNRRGYPVLVPKQFRLRPSGWGYQDLDQGIQYPKEGPDGNRDQGGEWFLSYGASIGSYTHSIDSDSIITQCWVTGTTAFDSTFTVASAGTGFNGSGDRIVFGPVSGSRDGLALTGGVQQLDTVSMDSAVLGLDWDIKPAALGLTTDNSDGQKQIEGVPGYYDGEPPQGQNTDQSKKNPNGVRRIQEWVNFLLQRKYINPLHVGGKYLYGNLPVDGKFDKWTEDGVQKMQTLTGATVNGVYSRNTYSSLKQWIQDNNHYLKFDIFWYVQNGKTWEEYVAALTGVHVPLKSSGQKQEKNVGGKNSTIPKWIIDDRGLNKAVNVWQKKFVQDAINIGNRKVDDSINRAGQRSISSNIADPRIQPGDVIWANVPGHQVDTDMQGGRQRPFSNGIYVSSVSRQMDLTTGTYTASYTGYRYIGQLGLGNQSIINPGYDFINNPKGSLTTGRG